MTESRHFSVLCVCNYSTFLWLLDVYYLSAHLLLFCSSSWCTSHYLYFPFLPQYLRLSSFITKQCRLFTSLIRISRNQGKLPQYLCECSKYILNFPLFSCMSNFSFRSVDQLYVGEHFPPTASPFFLLLSLFLGTCAMLVKETGVTVFGVCLVYDFFSLSCNGLKL